MPNRIIKESICASESIDGLSWFEECFFYRLIVNCDDYGRFDARPAVLKARLFPLKERITLKDVSSALTRLADMGIVRLYACDSKPYLYLTTWEVHQTIRAKKSRYPDPSDTDLQTHEIICKQMQADVPVIQSNPNPIRESNAIKRFVPPTLDEVTAFVLERGSLVDPQGFIDFYESKGWMVGKNPMKDWRAACRNAEGWERWHKPQQKPAASMTAGTVGEHERAAAEWLARRVKHEVDRR